MNVEDKVIYKTDVNFEHCTIIILDNEVVLNVLVDYDNETFEIEEASLIKSIDSWMEIKEVEDCCDVPNGTYTDEFLKDNIENQCRFTDDIISYYGVANVTGSYDNSVATISMNSDDINKEIENLILSYYE